ncbi:hypothetical protein [Actinomadura sp. 9N407]|uniref:hypothetical protein n=1 Tax=Actinomadura sp. 9N407 TaxID=3375154 RepID=UPI003789866D
MPSWSMDPPAEPASALANGALGPDNGALGPANGPSESTAPWSFEAEEDTGGYETAPPPPPAWAASEQPSGGNFVNNAPAAPPAPSAPAPPPAPPAPVGSLQANPMGSPSPGGLGDPSVSAPESIVPESWYARPRKPGAQSEQDQGVQQWAPQPQGFGMDNGQATFLDSGYPGGGATQLDQSPMNMGGPTGPMDSSLGPVGPYGPMGYEDGPHGYPPASRGSKASKPLLVAVSALVTVAVVSVGLVLWPGGDAKPPAAQPTPSASKNTPVAQNKPIGPARQQAIKVNELLNTSASARRALAGALNGTAKCETLPAAIRGFQGVAQQRSNQMRRTKALKVDKLRNGAKMKLTLYQAFKASLEADQRLLVWADKAKRKCRGKPRPNVAKAPGRISAERRATIAKKNFVAMWNPVARAAGQPQRQWNGL